MATPNVSDTCNLAASTYRLPPDAFTSPAWLAAERRALFDHQWVMVGDAAAVSAPGAYLTVSAGSTPLLVVRGHDGVLRAFVNMCRHRGMRLAEGCGSAARGFTCPYHGWRFDPEGRLGAVPQRSTQFPGIDLGGWGLLPASVAVWGGMLFVHPDESAAPLAEVLGEVPDHIGSFRPELLTQVAAVDLEGDFNWKLFVENHIDVYHLWYLHGQTLADFNHVAFEHCESDGNWTSYEPLRNPDVAGAKLTRGTTQIRHLDERDRIGIGAHMVFPNLLMASAAEFFATYAVYPVEPDRSRVELRIRAEPDADADALVTAARSFIDEDMAACEQIQAAIASPHFEIGPLSLEHESQIPRFQDHVLAALADHTVSPTNSSKSAASVHTTPVSITSHRELL